MNLLYFYDHELPVHTEEYSIFDAFTYSIPFKYT